MLNKKKKKKLGGDCMKKLIAISVMLALVAGAAFAETSISGVLEYSWNIVGSSGISGTDPASWTGFGDSLIQLQHSGDNYGGILRYKLVSLDGLSHNHGSAANNQAWIGGNVRSDIHNRAFMWWKPIEQLELFLGKDGDGTFNTSRLYRWNYHEGTRGVSVENWDSTTYFGGNWDNFGFALSIRPIDGLAIHYAVNLPNALNWGGNVGDGNMLLEDFGKDMMLQGSYYIEGVGTVDLTYRGEYFGESIGLTFYSGEIVENLEFEVGFVHVLTSGAANPTGIGVGAKYSGGEWGIKTRIFTRGFDALQIKVDVMPWYDLGVATAFCNVRIIYRDGGDLGWHVNPYLRKQVDSLQVRGGIMISDESGGGTVAWRIPVGASLSF
jgi:hypothetical protein